MIPDKVREKYFSKTLAGQGSSDKNSTIDTETNKTYEINPSDLALEQEEESKEEDFSPKLFDYIFLIDRSGSMSGTPMTLAVKALKLFLHSLPIGSRFNVFSFGSNFSSLFLTS